MFLHSKLQTSSMISVFVAALWTSTLAVHAQQTLLSFLVCSFEMLLIQGFSDPIDLASLVDSRSTRPRSLLCFYPKVAVDYCSCFLRFLGIVNVLSSREDTLSAKDLLAPCSMHQSLKTEIFLCWDPVTLHHFLL